MYLIGASGWLGDDSQVEAVRICKEVGMDAIPFVCNKNPIIYDERLLEFDNIPAIFLWDEPSATQFPLLMDKIDEFYQHYPKTMRCEINLYPSYTPLPTLATENYFEYIQKYVNEIQSKMQGKSVFSLDFYPLFKQKECTIITSAWLPCLSMFTHFAIEKNLPMHCFIQTMPFGIGNDVAQTFELLRFQFMVYFAFGFRAFTHFCYASPGVNQEFSEKQEAIIGRNGMPTPLYDSVRKVNALVQTFAKSYLPYVYYGTAKFSTEQIEDFNGWIDEFTLIGTAVSSFEADFPTLVGYFKKNKENEAFFITHYALPNKKAGKCVLCFKQKRTLRILKDGKTKRTRTDRLELLLDAGNGAFVEVIK